MLLILVYVLIAIVVGIYYYSKIKFNYWKNQKVPQIEPTPIVGNYGDLILQKKHVSYVLHDICKKFPDEPYIGVFYGTEPTLIVKDPELIKLITTKDFYYFSGREASAYFHKEPFNENLFFSSGDHWKVVRQNLTPVFTSAKMRNMFHLIAKCSYEFENMIETEIQLTDVIEVRALIARFTMACIASCAFGVDSDTLSKGQGNNKLAQIANSFFLATKYMAFKNTTKSIWPGLFYSLGLKVVPPGFDEFFKKFMLAIFEARDFKPTTRNDFVDFILTFKQKSHLIGDSITNLKTGGEKKVQLPVNDDLLSSQSALFFIAGFETSATTASYTLFELAKHPEALKKVQAEIDAYLEKYDNKLTYDIVNELVYTYACVEEAMRLYPVVVNVTREVVEDYTLPTGVHLEKDTRIHIPLYHIHRNPKYFPEPDVYRPERFLGDERQNIVPYSYIPFGEGSRICIGNRFAKMQVLAGMVTLLKKFDIKLDDSTPKIPKFDPLALIPTPKDPVKLKVIARDGWESRCFARV